MLQNRCIYFPTLHDVPLNNNSLRIALTNINHFLKLQQFMLSQQSAKSLGFKGKFYYSLLEPTFTSPRSLWNKQQKVPNTKVPFPKYHIYSYYKFGKTFGFETRRYLEYSNGILFYFQGEKDKECKGYCRLENLYMFYLTIEDHQLLHLTNGVECIQLFFNSNAFITNVNPTFFRNVVQMNFQEQYSIVELIGKGSFSKVYLAKKRENQRKVAVKIVSKKDKHGNSTKYIVEEEKKILAMLDSEFICRMEQFYEDDDAYMFVLEYLPGKDLMSVFKDKTSLLFKTIVHIFRCVLSGLANAHEHNVIHRDIKPQNIIIDEKTARLIDFGLSLIVVPNLDKKKYKRCGTMGYMAYEVIKNTNENRQVYTTKCDMFSFGIIAHMMLLDRNPLKGKNYEETFKKNSDCEIKLDKNLIIKKYGASGYQFLSGLLQKDPMKRWSAKEALESDFLKIREFSQITQMKSEIENTEETNKQYFEDHEIMDEDDVAIQKPKTQSINIKKVFQ